MGKSLRGKECGKGICQRKDGLYYARFVAKTGKRHEKYLPTLPEARNYYQYALILKIGLTWDAIDFEKRTLTVNKTLEFRHGEQYWRAGPPKTQHSYRTIPLTDRAYEILKEIKDKRPWQKGISAALANTEYIDRRTGQSPGWSCVILSLSTGVPGNRRKTVPMIPTFTSYVTKQELKNSVCTPCDIPTLQEQSKAVCSRRCCKNCWVMPASKQQWIGMFM